MDFLVGAVVLAALAWAALRRPAPGRRTSDSGRRPVAPSGHAHPQPPPASPESASAPPPARLPSPASRPRRPPSTSSREALRREDAEDAAFFDGVLFAHHFGVPWHRDRDPGASGFEDDDRLHDDWLDDARSGDDDHPGFAGDDDGDVFDTGGFDDGDW